VAATTAGQNANIVHQRIENLNRTHKHTKKTTTRNCADDAVGLGLARDDDRRAARSEAVGRRRQAKVAELQVAVGVDQEVRRLQIAMYVAQLVLREEANKTIASKSVDK
jgi:hypothetical protein